MQVTAYSASPGLLRGAAALRRKYGLAGHVHLLETRSQALQARRMLPSKSAVKHLHESGFLQLPGTSCAHSIWLTDEEIELMAKCEASVVHCPTSNLRLGSGVFPLSKMEAAGVNVAVGCDGAASSDGQDIVEVIKLATMLHTVSTPEYRQWPRARHLALDIAAKGGYKAVNYGGKAGVIAEGMMADVGLYNLSALSLLPRTDPLQLLVCGSRTQAPDAGSALDAAWVDGVRVIKDGSPVGVNLLALRKALQAGMPHYRDPDMTDPSTLPPLAAAETEYRASLCLDAPGGPGAANYEFGVPVEHAHYEGGRTLYPADLPLKG